MKEFFMNINEYIVDFRQYTSNDDEAAKRTKLYQEANNRYKEGHYDKK